MAFTKIQPQQLQLPTFTSPSGDFSFTDLSTGIQINLDRTITGPMVITELKTSAETTILTVADNNSFFGKFNLHCWREQSCFRR